MADAPKPLSELFPRENSHARGYDKHWARISRLKRQSVPVCEVCRDAPAVEVDHIQPFAGPDDPLRTDWGNLQSICRKCHALKTIREQSAG